MAITGLGVITSIGLGKRDFWTALVNGQSRLSDVGERFALRTKASRCCLVTDAALDERAARSTAAGRGALFATEAVTMALEDAGIDSRATAPGSLGLVLGTTLGESFAIEELIEERQGGRTPASDPAGRHRACSPESLYLAAVRQHHITGPVLLVPTACAASNYALGYAFEAVRSGRAGVMLAGGVEPFSRTLHIGFSRMKLVAPVCCQPFDRNRVGLLVSEGAGILVLEEYERARRRRAHVYAELLGFGTSCDAYHATAPEPTAVGAALALDRALRQARVTPGDVNYINAHGTGTPANDLAETRAIKRVFGPAAPRLPVSSIKSMLGHTMGAAGAIEAVACALVLQHQVVPPTINYQEPDPECDLDYVPNTARELPVRILASNSYGFMGHNASVVMAST